MDLRNDWDIDEVLSHPKLSDEFKLKFFEELFGEELTEENVEYSFKIWRGSSIPSSNVRKMMYNDESKELTVQFQDKSIYTYYDVSFQTFLNVTNGNATCITTGENAFGKWWKGKTPSVGASVHKFLIKTGVKYKRGGTLR